LARCPGHYFSTFIGSGQRLRFGTDCISSDTLGLGSGCHRRIGHFKQPEPVKTKLIGKYSQSHLAFIHKGLLEENGIQSFIFGDNFMSVMPNYSEILNAGIELRVKEEDFEEAMKLLKIENSEKLICENCGSENIKFSFGKNGWKDILFSIFSALIATIPFGNIKKHYYCKDCGFKIKN